MATRRQFLGAAAGAPAFPMIVKASALGLDDAPPPSDRVTLATIGTGWMGGSHLAAFLKIPAAQYVAVCDIDEDHLHEAQARIDKAYGNTGCTTYRAIEEVLLRRDIDAVSIALPDHWHAVAAVLALRFGKDVYGEKPLAKTFNEGLAIVEEQKKRSRIWQTGSWQRSKENFRRGCELVRNGRLGRIQRIEVGLPGGWTDFAKTKDQMQVTDPPPTVNYERWLGPSPEMPFIMARFHKNWRWNLAFGGGQLMDWVGHHVDIAHWGMGWDDVFPLEVEGVGEYPPRDAVWNSAGKYKVTARYPGGIEMVIAGGYPEIRGGTKWIGENGWLWVNRGNQKNPGIDAGPKSILDSVIGPDEVQLPKSPGHYEEFIASVKSRAATLTPSSVALHSATPGWLGQIAMLTGRRLKFDAAAMQIAGDSEADAMLGRKMRAPYQI